MPKPPVQRDSSSPAEGSESESNSFAQMALHQLSLTPEGHPDRFENLEFTFSAFGLEYNHAVIGLAPRNRKMWSDLENAIHYGEQAAAIMPKNSSRSARFLSILSSHLKDRYDEKNHIQDLETALYYRQIAVDMMPVDDPDRVFQLSRLAMLFRNRFCETLNMDDLEKAFDYGTEALNGAPLDLEDRIEVLDEIATCLSQRFQHCGNPADLQQAIEYGEIIIQEMPEGYADRSILLRNVAWNLKLRFEALSDQDSLEKALVHSEQALQAASQLDPHYSQHLKDLGIMCLHMYRHTGHEEQLQRAERCVKQALSEASSASDLNRSIVLDALGTIHMELFERTLDLQILQDAVRYSEEAVQAAGENCSRSQTLHSKILNNHANALTRRSEQTKDKRDIDKAIQFNLKAIDMTSEENIERRSLFRTLGEKYASRFGQEGRREDFESSVESCKRSLDLTPMEHHHDRAKTFNVLGTAYKGLSERTEQAEDLSSAIEYFEKALTSTPKKSAQQKLCLVNLGMALLERYKQFGAVEDLESTIDNCQNAFGLPPLDDLFVTPCLSNTLGSALTYRYERTGQILDLEEAIRHLRAAKAIVPSNDSDRLKCMHNLGAALMLQYDRNGRTVDLDEAIQLGESVHLEIPEADPRFSAHLHALGSRLSKRYDRTENLADLQMSIIYAQKCLHMADSVVGEQRNRALYLDSLASQLGTRYKRLGQTSDIELSIQYHNQAVESTAENDPQRVFWIHNQASTLTDRFRRTKSTDDLEQIIILTQKAADEVPKGDPERATIIYRLGSALLDGQVYLRIKDGLQRSTEAYLEGLSCTNGHPYFRLACGLNAISNLTRQGEWKKALAPLHTSLSILPSVTTPTHSRTDLRFTLRRISRFVSYAPSTLIKAGASPLEALHVFEQCRGILADRVMYGLPKREESPLLHSIFDVASDFRRMNISPHRGFYGEKQLPEHLHDFFDDVRWRLTRDPELEHLIFSVFPAREKELCELARDGPVVCLNMSTISAEAFLITSTWIDVLPLTELNEAQIKRCLQSFMAAQNLSRRAGIVISDDSTNEEDYKNIAESAPTPTMEYALEYIWRACVQPILQKLDLIGEKNPLAQPLQRIWWVGGGILSLTPLHAAGIHTPGSTHNTLSHVVSSYAPTLRSLQFTRRKQQNELAFPKLPRVLIVSMPTTPGGLHPLNVRDEVDAVQKFAHPYAMTTTLERPSKTEVLRALEKCTIAHFACHGTADSLEPASSSLLLGKHTMEKLAIKDLDALRHKTANIVFLSACSTAELRVQDLAYESVHLAGTFQLSGFKHVIASLWGVKDNAAAALAQGFYEGLQGIEKGDSVSVAIALHNSMVSLRDTKDNWRNPSLWAPFVHLGA